MPLTRAPTGLSRRAAWTASMVGVRCAPRLFTVRRLDEVAVAVPGAVVIGVDSVVELAGEIWEAILDEPKREPPRRSDQVVTWDEVLHEAFAFVLAHELEHVGQFERHEHGSTKILERRADFVAGQVAAIEARNLLLGQRVAYEIGCRDIACSVDYETPAGRLRDFTAGARSVLRESRPTI